MADENKAKLFPILGPVSKQAFPVIARFPKALWRRTRAIGRAGRWSVRKLSPYVLAAILAGSYFSNREMRNLPKLLDVPESVKLAMGDGHEAIDRYHSVNNPIIYYNIAAGVPTEEESKALEGYDSKLKIEDILNEEQRALLKKDPTKKIENILTEEQKEQYISREEFLQAFQSVKKKGIFDLVERGVAQQHANAQGFPRRAGFEAVFPEYAGNRSIARILVKAAELESEKGNFKQAADYYLETIEMGSDVGETGPLIGGLVGMAIRGIGGAGLQDLIESNRLDAKTARYIVQKLERLISEEPSMLGIMQREYVFGRAGLEKILLDKSIFNQGGNDVFGNENDGYQSLMFNNYISIPGIKSMTLRNNNLLWENMLDIYSKEDFAGMSKQDKFLQDNTPKYDVLNQMLFPVFSRAGMSWAMKNAMIKGIAIESALEAYKAEHGSYPKTLQELVEQKYLHEPTLQDTFSKKEFVYQSNGSEYRFYSIGLDLKDDGGTIVEPYTQLMNTERSPGDYVFQKPNELTNAIEAYRKDNGKYPGHIEHLIGTYIPENSPIVSVAFEGENGYPIVIDSITGKRIVYNTEDAHAYTISFTDKN